MRRITALSLGIALVGLLAGAPAAGTSVEDDQTAAMMVTVAESETRTSLIADTAPVDAIVPDLEGEVSIDDLTPVAPDASFDGASNLLHGHVLYDMDARPTGAESKTATALDGIAGFAQGLVVGLNEADLGDVRISN